MRALAVCAAIALCAAEAAHAAQRLQVCAREAAGRAYQVQATYLTGQELVNATHSFAYDIFSGYVVIFWSPQQASVIRLEYPTLSGIPMEGTDRQGRRWSIAVTPYCF